MLRDEGTQLLQQHHRLQPLRRAVRYNPAAVARAEGKPTLHTYTHTHAETNERIHRNIQKHTGTRAHTHRTHTRTYTQLRSSDNNRCIILRCINLLFDLHLMHILHCIPCSFVCSISGIPVDYLESKKQTRKRISQILSVSKRYSIIVRFKNKCCVILMTLKRRGLFLFQVSNWRARM